MKQAIDFDKVETLSVAITDYAKTLGNADCIRLAGFLLGLVNAVQQCADITHEDMFHARETTTLFDEVEEDDTTDPGYHLHNLLDNLADEFNELADTMDEGGKDAEAAARDAALAKLTDAEKILLGLGV